MNQIGDNDLELHARGLADTGTSLGTAGESQLLGIQSLMQSMGPQAIDLVQALLTQLQGQTQVPLVRLPQSQPGASAETALTPGTINDQLIVSITGRHKGVIDAFALERGRQAYDKALAEGITPEEAENIGEAAREEARLIIIQSIVENEAKSGTPRVKKTT